MLGGQMGPPKNIIWGPNWAPKIYRGAQMRPKSISEGPTGPPINWGGAYGAMPPSKKINYFISAVRILDVFLGFACFCLVFFVFLMFRGCFDIFLDLFH